MAKHIMRILPTIGSPFPKIEYETIAIIATTLIADTIKIDAILNDFDIFLLLLSFNSLIITIVTNKVIRYFNIFKFYSSKINLLD